MPRLKHRSTTGDWVEVTGDVERSITADGTPLAFVLERMQRLKVEPLHRDEVVEEAERLANTALDLDSLVDLRHLPFVPIDEVTSRDLDQAVAIESNGDGHTVWYAIADAAFFIRPGSALYEDALRRGATYYTPAWIAPMVPRVLSEDRMSLNAGVERRAMVFEHALDGQGVCTATKVHRAAIRCRHKLDFGGVQAFLDGRSTDWDADVQASLRHLPTVGRRRMARSRDAGVAQYRRAEVDTHLAEGAFVAIDGPRHSVERYNEQISLLSNTEGARILMEHQESKGVEPLFRVHDAPAEADLDRYAELTRRFAESHDLPDLWTWNRATTSLADYLEGLPTGRRASALHRQAMILNRPSVFSTVARPHHGVGVDAYSRFTAPMREVVGVFVHHEMWEALAGEPLHPGHGQVLRDQVLEVSNRARQVQRQLDRDINLHLLDAWFGGEFEEATGTVVGLGKGRLHIQLDEPKLDIKATVEHQGWGDVLSDDRLAVSSPSGRTFVQLGDAVRVTVDGRDGRRWRVLVSVL